MVSCAQCGRQVRRDKAVFIEKPVFTNPLNRDEVSDEHYTRMLTREFAYCPSCGKHFRIYQKKTRQNERNREREKNRQFFPQRPGKRHVPTGPMAPAAGTAPAVQTTTEQAAVVQNLEAAEAPVAEPEAEESEEGESEEAEGEGTQ